MAKPFIDQHQRMIEDAALTVIAVADDSSVSLIDVIAAMERYIVQETKVGDAKQQRMPPHRRGYTLVKGRLIEVGPNAGKPPKAVDGKHGSRHR